LDMDRQVHRVRAWKAGGGGKERLPGGGPSPRSLERLPFAEKVILAKISRAQFDDIVTPGDQIAYHAEIENITPDAAVTKGTVISDDRRIGTIDLMFSHIDQNLAGQQFPEENFVFTGQFERLVAPFLESGDG